MCLRGGQAGVDPEGACAGPQQTKNHLRDLQDLRFIQRFFAKIYAAKMLSIAKLLFGFT